MRISHSHSYILTFSLIHPFHQSIRQTDEIRTSLGSRFGLVLQYSVTFLSNVILSLVKSFKLSLVILSTVPLIALITLCFSSKVSPLVSQQTSLESNLASELSRVIDSITLIKAFNAQPLELLNLNRLIKSLSSNYHQLVRLCATRLGLTHTLGLMMFVQGFGYGAHLIAKGEVSAGEVNTVFWSCLVASSYMQMAIPLLTHLERFPPAVLDLINLLHPVLAHHHPASDQRLSLIPLRDLYSSTSILKLEDAPTDSLHPLKQTASLPSSSSPLIRFIKLGSPASQPPAFRPLRKPIPTQAFKGHIEFENVTFSYPSQTISSSPNILQNVSLFFPAGDLTFVMGESGSGKSTIASLALGIYLPQSGQITLDDLGLVSKLNSDWIRSQSLILGSISSQFILPATIHENIAILSSSNQVSRSDVIRAAKFSLLHEFIITLPLAYDTLLAGHDGQLSGLVNVDQPILNPNHLNPSSLSNLSGGQLQRLALARAYLRDPTVLILGESHSFFFSLDHWFLENELITLKAFSSR